MAEASLRQMAVVAAAVFYRLTADERLGLVKLTARTQMVLAWPFALAAMAKPA